MHIYWHEQDLLYLAATGCLFLFRTWLIGKVIDLGEKFTLKAEKWLVRSEREAIEWYHYKQRAAKQAHKPRKPLVCNDESCTKIVK